MRAKAIQTTIGTAIVTAKFGLASPPVCSKGLSHKSPVNFSVHAHVKETSSSVLCPSTVPSAITVVHEPEFIQGELSHGSIIPQLISIYPSAHVHTALSCSLTQLVPPTVLFSIQVSEHQSLVSQLSPM